MNCTSCTRMYPRSGKAVASTISRCACLPNRVDTSHHDTDRTGYPPPGGGTDNLTIHNQIQARLTGMIAAANECSCDGVDCGENANLDFTPFMPQKKNFGGMI